MSKEALLEWNPDDGFLYEYANGFAEQTTGVNNKERYIISNIQDKFTTTNFYRKQARLFGRSDVWVTDMQKRIPDMALLPDSKYWMGPTTRIQFRRSLSN